MATDPISGNNNNSNPPAKKDNSSAQAQKDQFLQILLTQLQHQNPTDPMKPEQFASQLAQFSALEQQVDTNTKLDKLIATLDPKNVAPVSYLGRTVDYTSPTAPVQGGKASFTYNVPGATEIKIEVRDSTGVLVYSADGDITAGDHHLVLEAAQDNSLDGAPLTMTVIAKNANGDTIPATITAHAKVTAVSTVSGDNYLEATGYPIPISKVTRISTDV